MPICKYCKKSCSTHSNLKIHQETTLSCLKIQGILPTIFFSCGDCSKNFTTRRALDKHCKICIKKYKRIIQELEAEIEHLTSLI